MMILAVCLVFECCLWSWAYSA